MPSPHDTLPRYSETDLQNARTKGQVLGWVQGGGAVALFLVLLSFIGWIPLLALGAIVLLFVWFGLKR